MIYDEYKNELYNPQTDTHYKIVGDYKNSNHARIYKHNDKSKENKDIYKCDSISVYTMAHFYDDLEFTKYKEQETKEDSDNYVTLEDVIEEQNKLYNEDIKRSEEILDKTRDTAFEPHTVLYGNYVPMFFEFPKHKKISGFNSFDEPITYPSLESDYNKKIECPEWNQELFEEIFLNKKQKNKGYKRLRKLLALIKSNERLRSNKNDRATLISILHTSKYNLRLFGNKARVHEVLWNARLIKLIEFQDERYRYNTEKTTNTTLETYGKQYLWHHVIEEKVRNICDKLSLTEWKPHENLRYVKPRIYNLESISDDKIVIHQHTNIHVPEKMRITDFLYSLNERYYKKYPILKKNEQIMKRYNEQSWVTEEMKLHASLSFKFDKKKTKVISVGYRDFAMANSLPKINEFNKETGMPYKTRSEFLKANRLNYEFDVKSSVPRTEVFRNTGRYFNQDEDIYELLWNELKHKRLWAESFREARPVIKKFFMNCNFSKSIDKAVLSQSWKMSKNKFVSIEKEDFIKWVTMAFEDLTNAIYKVCGKQSGSSEVFLHETSITLLALDKLVSKGIRVYKCYDAFYTNQYIDFNTLMKKSSLQYKKENPQFFNDYSKYNVIKEMNKVMPNPHIKYYMDKETITDKDILRITSYYRKNALSNLYNISLESISEYDYTIADIFTRDIYSFISSSYDSIDELEYEFSSYYHYFTSILSVNHSSIFLSHILSTFTTLYSTLCGLYGMSKTKSCLLKHNSSLQKWIKDCTLYERILQLCVGLESKMTINKEEQQQKEVA